MWPRRGLRIPNRGRRLYDAVMILEAPDEKTALKTLMRGGDYLNTETLLAIPRAEALKLLE